MATKHMICGIHSVQLILEKAPQRVVQLWLAQKGDNARLNQVQDLARRHGLVCQPSEASKLTELCGYDTHQGVVAQCQEMAYTALDQLQPLCNDANRSAFFLVLDGVQDPHNLGACLRTACAAGVQAVILPRDKAVGITPIVHKVSCGATQVLPIVMVTNLARALKQLQDWGVWIYGAAEQADQSLYQTDLSRGNIAWVMGSEQKGLRQLTRRHCDNLVSIPTHDALASLNVSVATAVCLFETVRQRTRH